MPCRRAVIALEEAERVLDALLDHMAEHATVIRSEDGARLESPFANVDILRLSETILVDVVAPSPEILAMVRHFIAEHVFEFAGEGTQIDWNGDGVNAGTGPPPQFSRLQVVEAFDLTPGMRRVVFACDRPGLYLGDVGYHIRLLLPPAGRVPVWPQQRPDGRLDWPTGEDALVSRVYTIRKVSMDSSTIAVDFVLHEGGHSPGADFARHAQAGDVVGLMGPGGDGLPQGRRLLLLGDEAALPAMARMIAEAAPETEIEALIELADPAEIRPFARQVSVTWLCRSTQAKGDDAPMLEAALEIWLEARSPGEKPQVDFIWGGCERAVAARIRKRLL